MWPTLTLLATLGLAPAQGGDLELTNVRATYGLLGPTRSVQGLLPGDVLFVSFDIANVHVDDSGRILYSLGMEVVDGRGKIQYKQDPQDKEGTNSLGGTSLPAFANVRLGLDQPPGQYTLRVTVTDRAVKRTKSLEQKFEVLPKGFGIVGVGITADAQGLIPAPAVGVTGQPVWVHCFLVGFERGGAKKQPNLALEMVILDERGQPTVPKPTTGEVTEKELGSEATNVPAIPIDFNLVLNRAGKFTIRLTATDRLANKASEVSLPLAVLDQR